MVDGQTAQKDELIKLMHGQTAQKKKLNELIHGQTAQKKELNHLMQHVLGGDSDDEETGSHKRKQVFSDTEDDSQVAGLLANGASAPSGAEQQVKEGEPQAKKQRQQCPPKPRYNPAEYAGLKQSFMRDQEKFPWPNTWQKACKHCHRDITWENHEILFDANKASRFRWSKACIIPESDNCDASRVLVSARLVTGATPPVPTHAQAQPVGSKSGGA